MNARLILRGFRVAHLTDCLLPNARCLVLYFVTQTPGGLARGGSTFWRWVYR
jgi:hypothetical protein